MQWLQHFCDVHNAEVQREDAYIYAQSPSGVAPARDEYDACHRGGLDVQGDDDADVPFAFHGGVRLPWEGRPPTTSDFGTKQARSRRSAAGSDPRLVGARLRV